MACLRVGLDAEDRAGTVLRQLRHDSGKIDPVESFARVAVAVSGRKLEPVLARPCRCRWTCSRWSIGLITFPMSESKVWPPATKPIEKQAQPGRLSGHEKSASESTVATARAGPLAAPRNATVMIGSTVSDGQLMAPG